MCQGPIDTPLFLHVQYLGQHLFEVEAYEIVIVFVEKQNILSIFVYNINH